MGMKRVISTEVPWRAAFDNFLHITIVADYDVFILMTVLYLQSTLLDKSGNFIID